MDELRPQAISPSLPKGGTSSAAQTAINKAGQQATTAQTSNTQASSNQASTATSHTQSKGQQTPITTTTTSKAGPISPTVSSSTANIQATASSPLQALTQQLTQAATITVTVKSAQIIDSKAQQLINTVNPQLAASIVQAQQNTSTKIQSSHQPLYLVKLAQGLQQASLLTTVTPTAFKAGDQLQLQLNTQGQIVIKPSIASVRPAIAEGLKTALPLQQNISPLLSNTHTIQTLPSNIQSLLLSPTTRQALQTLSQAIQTPESLLTGGQVKNALANSGLFTEQKLQTQTSLQGDLRVALSTLLNALGNSTSGSTSAEVKSHLPLEQILSQVITLATNPSGLTKPEGNQQLLTGLLQLLGLKTTPQAHSDAKKVKGAIAHKLGQLATGAQEKIQLNQLRAFSNDTASQEPSSNRTATFNAEIPLRWGDQVLPLQLSIKEEPPKKQHSQEAPETEGKKITRRWQVFLSFDLPGQHANTIEQLHTQLTVIENTVSATLWTSSELLCKKAKQQLTLLRNSLTAKGLEVEDLHCIKGKPPQQTLSLDYNLVDIRT